MFVQQHIFDITISLSENQFVFPHFVMKLRIVYYVGSLCYNFLCGS